MLVLGTALLELNVKFFTIKSRFLVVLKAVLKRVCLSVTCSLLFCLVNVCFYFFLLFSEHEFLTLSTHVTLLRVKN